MTCERKSVLFGGVLGSRTKKELEVFVGEFVSLCTIVYAKKLNLKTSSTFHLSRGERPSHSASHKRSKEQRC